MVRNLSKLAKTDISISTTGIAGPSGGTPAKLPNKYPTNINK